MVVVVLIHVTVTCGKEATIVPSLPRDLDSGANSMLGEENTSLDILGWKKLHLWYRLFCTHFVMQE